jgi:hypothetical protein
MKLKPLLLSSIILFFFTPTLLAQHKNVEFNEPLPNDFITNGHILIFSLPQYSYDSDFMTPAEIDSVKHILQEHYKGKFVVISVGKTVDMQNKNYWGNQEKELPGGYEDTSVYKYILRVTPRYLDSHNKHIQWYSFKLFDRTAHPYPKNLPEIKFYSLKHLFVTSKLFERIAELADAFSETE